MVALYRLFSGGVAILSIRNRCHCWDAFETNPLEKCDFVILDPLAEAIAFGDNLSLGYYEFSSNSIVIGGINSMDVSLSAIHRLINPNGRLFEFLSSHPDDHQQQATEHSTSHMFRVQLAIHFVRGPQKWADNHLIETPLGLATNELDEPENYQGIERRQFY